MSHQEVQPPPRNSLPRGTIHSQCGLSYQKPLGTPAPAPYMVPQALCSPVLGYGPQTTTPFHPGGLSAVPPPPGSPPTPPAPYSMSQELPEGRDCTATICVPKLWLPAGHSASTQEMLAGRWSKQKEGCLPTREALPAGGCSRPTVKCCDQHYRLDQVQGFREAGPHGRDEEVCSLHHPLVGQAGFWQGALLVFTLGEVLQGLWCSHSIQVCRHSSLLLRSGGCRGLLLTAFLFLHGRKRWGPVGHKTSLLDTRAHCSWTSGYEIYTR